MAYEDMQSRTPERLYRTQYRIQLGDGVPGKDMEQLREILERPGSDIDRAEIRERVDEFLATVERYGVPEHGIALHITALPQRASAPGIARGLRAVRSLGSSRRWADAELEDSSRRSEEEVEQRWEEEARLEELGYPHPNHRFRTNPGENVD